MGRHKKPIGQHKLEGTYKDCIHGKNVEPVISNYLEIPEKILPPETIKDNFIFHVPGLKPPPLGGQL
jgi:hypothetical protein